MQIAKFCGGTDIPAMLALARAFLADNLRVVDLGYRLSSWALDDPENVGLWVSAQGQLLAWAVMQTPFWTIDYAYHPDGGADLHRQILAWADQRARQLVDSPDGHPCWFVMVFDNQTDRIRDLEQTGFACQANVGEDSWSKVLMLHRPAQLAAADHTLPESFTIRPLAGKNEVDAYVQLHQTVFESKNMTTEWRTRTLNRPAYRPDLDLVAVAPDGRLAAFCICWLDKGLEKPAGQIEPLGVHPDFRQLGLGQLLLSEGLRRLYRCGADRVYVETDKYRNAALKLYESVGFRVIQDVLVYRRDYETLS